MKYHLKKAAVILGAALLCACSSVDEPRPEEAEPVLLTGVSQETLTAEEETAPQRLISLSPAATEMLFELGCGDMIAAVGNYCSYPTAADMLPKAGSAANPEKEKLYPYAPAVLITESPVSKTDMTDLGDRGIRTVILDPPGSISELRDKYAELAALCGSENAEDAADAAVEGIYRSAQNACKIDGSLLFFLSNSNTATPDTVIGDIVTIFGDNAAFGYHNYNMPKDKIIMTDPDVIILSDKLDYWKFTEEYAELTAVKESKTIIVEGELAERPTSRLSELIDYISANLKLIYKPL